VSQLWRFAVMETEPPRLDMEVTDETSVAFVIFVYRRYLTGQSVLATTVREQAWIGRGVPHKQSAEDMTLLVMRVLRGSPGALITEDIVCELDLELKRALASTDARRAEAARQRLVRLFELLDDVGAGRLFEDGLGRTYLHKYCRSGLRKRTLEWLQQNRVPGLLFGVKLVAHAEEPERGSALRNTNPSESVQARKARAVVKEVSEASQGAVDDSVEQCGKRSRHDVDKSLPTARRPCRQTAAGEGQTLMSEIVPGVFLDQSSVRARLRTVLAACRDPFVTSISSRPRRCVVRALRRLVP